MPFSITFHQIKYFIGFYLMPLIIIFLLFYAQYSSAAVRLPSANRECASCHIMWLTDFKRDDVTPLIDYNPKPVMNSGKQDIASSEPICFSCHDGFVLESRFLWEKNKHAHPVGQKPSKNIKIPIVDGKNLFPLNEEGRMYCGTCHSAHGVSWDQKKTAVFMRVANEDGQLCMACHKDKIKGPKHGSHPLKRKIQKLLAAPPQKLMDAGARFADGGEVICQSCHKPHGAAEKKLLLVKNDKSQLCGQCHISRYAKSRQQAGEMFTHPVNIKPQQVKIPSKLLNQGSKLGSSGEIICQTCHRPHDATPDTSLLVVNNNNDSLCQKCHVKQKQVVGSKHDMSLARKDSKNIRDQQAGKSGACSACHVPHKGKGLKMWARPVDATQDPMAALCLSCHNKKGIANKHTTGKYSHPVGVNISRLGKKVKLPTFDRSGMKLLNVKKGKVTCATCHNPHQWNSTNTNDKGKVGSKGNKLNRFLRIKNEDSALCKVCHDEKWRIEQSKHDMRVMAPEAKNSEQQTAKQSSICGACHLVHNANAERLWARSDVTGKEQGYAACLGCHNKDGLAKNKTLGKHSHPINVDIQLLGITAKSKHWSKDQSHLTKAKTPLQPLPLYDKSGRPVDNNGMVGCGSCHDPHSWSSLSYKQAKDPSRLEGDTDSSFLRIADQSKSSLCVNCHVSKKSIYLTKHDLTDEADDYLNKVNTKDIYASNKLDNVIGDGLAGPCMHCHTPHNAKGEALWARNTGTAETPIAAMCSDCHKNNGLAENKLPGKHMHPLGVDSKQIKHDKQIPFYNEQGKRDHKNGKVDCASCHNPHQWDPKNADNKAPEISNIDGTTETSFLRKTANENSELCISCHNDKKSIIGTDHDLSVTAPGALNVLQQKKSNSGVCGQCHIPHQSKDPLYLWARVLSDEGDPVERRCRSCHDQSKIASAKVPDQAKHPQQINIWSAKLRRQIYGKDVPQIIPFNKQGRPTEFGAITCASCHNPHQWQANSAQPGSGKNLEGDAMNSFLRNNDSKNIVCEDCHGKDSIYRYKYFHTDGAHEKHHMFE